MSGYSIRGFARDRRGGVTILAALLLPVMIGICALVLEFGGGMLTKSRLQRVADIAAYSAATAYSRLNTTASITSAAQMVGRLNGVPNSAVTAALVASPKGDGSQVIQVTIAQTNRLVLARVIGFTKDLPVAATAYASMGGGTTSCVLALSNSGAGVTLSGGVSISAPKCGVASNVSIAVPCGTTITAKEAAYGGAAPSVGCSGMKDASGAVLTPKKKTTDDPLASDSGVATATARVPTVSALAAPAAPSVSTGKDIDFAWNQSGTISQAASVGCTATWSQPTWTLTCASGGTYNFGQLTIGGGIALKFNTNSTASTKYNFSGKVALTGSTVDFGAGTYVFSKGMSVGGGTTATFGAGTFSFGQGADYCNDGNYSICNTGTSLTFGGPSTFTIAYGVYVGGGSNMSFGSGTTNSYTIGPSSSGHSITAGGGAKTFFADATSGLFQLTGNLNVTSGGGSCMTLPAAPQHDIKGFFASAGGTTLGAGVYTATGYIAFGANGGGDVTCNGQTVGVKGTDVTLVTGGLSTIGSGSCQGRVFCLGSGYGNVAVAAPSSGATSKLVIVGPTGSNNAGLMFTGGANANLSGVLYFPKGPVTMSGGASMGSGASQCLQIIGSEVTLSGGTTAASTCIGGATSSGVVAIVQ